MYTQTLYDDTLKDLEWGSENGLKINCDDEIGEGLPKGGCGDSTFSLADMKVLEEECGQSRLWGGMHFGASVPGGSELCAGISEQTFNYMKEIMAETDFAGQEYFKMGDNERPTCPDPSTGKDMSGPPPGEDEGQSVTDLFFSGGVTHQGGFAFVVSILAYFSLIFMS